MSAHRLQADRMVAAVDFGDDWENMLAHAAMLARRRDSELHLVHVLQPPSWLMARVLDERDLEAHRKDQEEVALRRLQHANAGLSGVRVRTSIRFGKPSVEVVGAVEQDRAGLLVLGTGEPSGSAVLLGGTADRLLRVSSVPVYVCGPRPPEPCEKILVPTALGPGGRAALQVALDTVRPGGTVYALHMVALPSVMRSFSGDVMSLRRKLAAGAEEEFRAHLAQVQVPDGVRLEPILRTNLEVVPADRTIVKEARELGVQLICLALGGRGLGHGLLIGRVSEKVIRALPCALLALPDVWVDQGKSAAP